MYVIVFHNQNSTTHSHGGNHTYYELEIGVVPILDVDKTHGYEIPVFDHGTSHKSGDGGFVNWYCDGNLDVIGRM